MYFIDSRNSQRFFFEFSIKWICIGSTLLFPFLVLSYRFANQSYSVPVLFVLFSNGLLLLYGIILGSKDKPQNDIAHFIHCLKPQSVLELTVKEELNHSLFYWKFIGEVTKVDLKETSGMIIIRLKKSDSILPFMLNDKIYTRQSPTEFGPPLHPGAFNYGQYMNKKGIYHQLTLGKSAFIKRNSKSFSIRHRAMRLRDRILNSLERKGFADKEFSIIQALLLGQKKDLSIETRLSYQNAGAMHILAISGLHIGIILMLLNFILGPLEFLKFGKLIKCVLLILFLWAFAFVSGLSSSVIRACSLFTILTIGLQFRRSAPFSNYLFVALFLSLIFKPLVIFDLGFQLSYAAVFGIIGFVPILTGTWLPKTKVVRYFWNLFCVSMAAQLAVLPLVLYYFHHFSALFVLSSFCVIPILGFVLGFGYFMVILDQLGYLSQTYVNFYDKLIQGMNFIVQLIGNIDGFSFHEVFFNLPMMFMAYLLIISFCHYLKSKKPQALLQTLLLLCLFFSIVLFKKWSTQKSSEFVVFHQYKNSLFLKRTGDQVVMFRAERDGQPIQNSSLKDYGLTHLNLNFKRSDRSKNFFTIGEDRIMIVDDSNILSEFDPDFLVLVNSPKVNLQRLLGKIKPRMIIADGSNYSSFKSDWKRTAKRHGILFHDTALNGAFSLETGS